MKKIITFAATLSLVAGFSVVGMAQCETGDCGSHGHAFQGNIVRAFFNPGDPAGQSWPCYGDCTNFSQGNTDVTCPLRGSYPSKREALFFAARDPFSPRRLYAYNKSGVDAALINKWNNTMAQTKPWHGGYNYWRWNQPTALVIPPTASFSTSYGWGVGQTRSLPNYHQFGRTNPGGGLGVGGGMFSSPPYWPSSTNQLGVYPVRGAW